MPTPGERFDLRDIRPQPWKNGAGLTREIAASPPEAGAGVFDWRISIAEVERDGPFSAFPGIDRSIVLLRGGGMLLASADGRLAHRLDRPHQPFSFPGDLALAATLLAGPTTDFNVMAHRGAWRAEVVPIDGAAELAGGDAGLLLCSTGEWLVEGQVPAEPALGPLQGLLWRQGMPETAVRPRQPDAGSYLLAVLLRR